MAILATNKNNSQKKKPTSAIITIWLKNGYLQNKYTYYYIFFQGEVYKILNNNNTINMIIFGCTNRQIHFINGEIHSFDSYPKLDLDFKPQSLDSKNLD
jgi:hypothetical protein